MARINPDDHLQNQSILIHSDQENHLLGLQRLPLLRVLRETWPRARIEWVAGAGPSAYDGSLKPLMAGLLDRVRDSAGIGGGLFGWAKQPLPGERFDWVIDIQDNLGAAMAAKNIGHGKFISSAWGYMASEIKPPPGRPPAPTLSHRLFDLLEMVLGREPGYPRGAIPLPADVRDLAQRLLPPGKSYVALAIGSVSLARRWPFDFFIAAANSLEEAGYVPVFLAGSADEKWVSSISAAAPGGHFPLQNPRVKPFQDRPDLFLALAERCLGGVANEGAGSHLLAAANLPTVTIVLDAAAEAEGPAAPLAKALICTEHGGRIDAVPPMLVLDRLGALLNQAPRR